MIAKRAEHEAYVQKERQPKIDEKKSIEERLKSSGMVLRSKHNQDQFRKHEANIQVDSPDIAKMKMDVEKANRRIGVNERLMNPRRINSGSRL